MIIVPVDTFLVKTHERKIARNVEMLNSPSSCPDRFDRSGAPV
jgi:hypothetical protein